MFAEVYPILRLPRRFRFFDYACDASVQAGDIVFVPFKGRTVAGVVKAIKQTSDAQSVKAVERILLRRFLTEADINRFDRIAASIAQSPATLLYFAFRDLTESGSSRVKPISLHRPSTKSVSPETAEAIKSALAALEKTSFLRLDGSNEASIGLASLLAKKSGQILVLCPRGLLAEQTQKLLEGSVVLHGHIGMKDRAKIIREWQNGQRKILVGTRQASLLPAKHLSAVIVLEDASDEYAEQRQNPRFDVRLAAELLAKSHGAHFIASGPAPRMESAKKTAVIVTEALPTPKVVSLQAKEEFTGTPFVTESAKTATLEALQNGKKVLCSFNKKGVAKRLQCSTCGHIPLCGTCSAVPTVRNDDLVCHVCHAEMWIPETCPSCRKKTLKKKGIGNKAIQAALTSLFPGYTVELIDKENPRSENADILVVTEYFFKRYDRPFERMNLGAVIELAFDLALVGHNFRTSEQALFKLHRLNAIAHKHRVPCIIQTWLPDIVNAMVHREAWVKNELAVREKYQLPPFSDQVLLTEKAAGQLINTLPPDTFTIHLEEGILLTSPAHAKSALEQFLAELPDSVTATVDTATYESTPSTKTSG